MQAIDQVGSFTHHRMSCPRQLAQFALALRRNEGRRQQTVRHQFAEPLGILHVGLATGHMLDVLGIDDQKVNWSSNML